MYTVHAAQQSASSGTSSTRLQQRTARLQGCLAGSVNTASPQAQQNAGGITPGMAKLCQKNGVFGALGCTPDHPTEPRYSRSGVAATGGGFQYHTPISCTPAPSCL